MDQFFFPLKLYCHHWGDCISLGIHSPLHSRQLLINTKRQQNGGDITTITTATETANTDMSGESPNRPVRPQNPANCTSPSYNRQLITITHAGLVYSQTPNWSRSTWSAPDALGRRVWGYPHAPNLLTRLSNLAANYASCAYTVKNFWKPVVFVVIQIKNKKSDT